MTVPVESASFTDAEAADASESLQLQIASARAAVAKHHARLVDQIDAETPGAAPFETGTSSD